MVISTAAGFSGPPGAPRRPRPEPGLRPRQKRVLTMLSLEESGVGLMAGRADSAPEDVKINAGAK
jgi:hypothetical protein